MIELIKRVIEIIFRRGKSCSDKVYLIKREWRFYKQRITRGFDGSDLWNLFYVIAEFVHPRLLAFQENLGGYPATLSEEEWKDILKQMSDAFELVIAEDERCLSDEERLRRDKGLQLFGEYFLNLWD